MSLPYARLLFILGDDLHVCLSTEEVLAVIFIGGNTVSRVPADNSRMQAT
jgi:hypothetical protein